jgi:hypothetical protein
VLLVDPNTGHEWARLEASHLVPIGSLRFNTDGSQLAAVCASSRVIQLWDLRSIRQQLASMNLDWDAPPLPPPPTNEFRGPITVTILTNSVEAKSP